MEHRVLGSMGFWGFKGTFGCYGDDRIVIEILEVDGFRVTYSHSKAFQLAVSPAQSSFVARGSRAVFLSL